MSQATARKLYSPEEYLTFEETALERHEYLDGEIRLMPGGMPNHNKISGRSYALLLTGLDSQPFDVFHADQRLWIPEKNTYTYPDVMVLPDPWESQPGREDNLMNPVLIAEVLSKSTQAYDRDEKFDIYKAIPSLREYLLVDQYQLEVWQFIKQPDHQWSETILNGLDATLALTIANITIKLTDLYQKTNLTSTAS
ncbi:Uma2 family endonuclease [Synechococcus sp. PCC 6312]|uniref:Uma2 family endonuclease n=1 Tax=Synechococcus sp. (strain ATCC 27167 / PCC 6312) TaxID=195253 RepID=UPI00029F1853|nr:Uma2 family endonuclease [Synechococcus sp. PCC 6312]AFY59411.1 hypothetical protein Syn6312_0160 [Synechococcus sp. PCC 6312]